jgi:hypothetical protein
MADREAPTEAETRKTLEHFAKLKANADRALLERVLARTGGDAPAEDDRVPTR